MGLTGFNTVVIIVGLQHPEVNIIDVFPYSKLNVYSTRGQDYKEKHKLDSK